MVELTIIIIYFLVMIAIGLWSKKGTRSLDNFFVFGRKGSALFITGSLVATIIGGSATIGMAGLGFKQGLTGAWWLLVGSIGLLVLGVFFARKVREYGLYTLPEIAGKQYDGRIALASSILIVIAWVGIVAGQIIAAGTIMGILGMGSPILWMVIFTVVFTGYTVLGGQFAVIRTDLLQAIIIFAGIFGGLAVVMTNVGGMEGLKSHLAPDQFAFPLSSQYGGLSFVKQLLLVGLAYVVGPDMYSRLLCAKDSRTARTSVFWAACLIIPFAFGITLMGMGARALLPQLSAPEMAFPAVIKEVLHPVAGTLVLAALLSAVMSSADTTLLSASTIFTVDIVARLKPSLSQEKTLLLSRLGIVVIGLISLALALVLKGVINALMFAYTVYTAGVILPVIVGFYRKKLRVTPIGALAAIVGGGAAGVVSKLFNITNLDLGALLISLVLLFGVSFIDNRVRNKGGIGKVRQGI